VGTASPSEVAALLERLASERTPTLGAGRLVCIDGPAGSGKSTLAAAFAARTGAEGVHTDDLMEGWRGLDAVARQLSGLVALLAEGRPGRYRHYDWHAGRYDRTVEVAPAPWLVVEGVGSGATALSACTTLLVWVEAEDALRLDRGIQRDGAAMEPHWRQFMADEQEVFARDRTRDRADVLVDGTGARSPVVR